MLLFRLVIAAIRLVIAAIRLVIAAIRLVIHVLQLHSSPCSNLSIIGRGTWNMGGHMGRVHGTWGGYMVHGEAHMRMGM